MSKNRKGKHDKKRKKSTARVKLASTAQKLARAFSKEAPRKEMSNVVDLDMRREQQSLENHLEQIAEGFPEGITRRHYMLWSAFADLTSIVMSHPAMDKWTKKITAAEDRYHPSQPPMSPVLESAFHTWALCDLRAGVERQSVAEVTVELMGLLGLEEPQRLAEYCASVRLFVLDVRDYTDGWFDVEELVTGRRLKVEEIEDVTPAHGNQLWLARLMEEPGTHLASILGTPYVLEASKEEWRGYFDRNLPSAEDTSSPKPADARLQAHEKLMRAGPDGSGWVEYMLDGYAGFDACVHLAGVPDKTETLPHAGGVARSLMPQRTHPGNALEEIAKHAAANPASGIAPVHAIDNRLVVDIIRHANQTFADAWLDFVTDPEDQIPLLIPWLVYEHQHDGKTLLEHYLDAHPSQPQERVALIEAQKASWLGVWEVQSVAAPILVVRDLLTEALREVKDVAMSKSLGPRSCFLARIVQLNTDFAGTGGPDANRSSADTSDAHLSNADGTVVVGAHTRVLAPRAAEEVVRQIKRLVRKRKAVPWSLLKPTPIQRALIEAWDDAAMAEAQRFEDGPEIIGPDGEPMLLVEVRALLKNGCRKAVEAALRNHHLIDLEDDGTYVLHDALGRVSEPSLADITLKKNHLVAQCLSEAAADKTRDTLHMLLGSKVTKWVRSIEDPWNVIKERRKQRPADSTPPRAAQENPEVPRQAAQLIQDFKREHYRRWLEEPIPALQGKTPRQAAKSAAGKKQLDVLLRDIEFREAGLPVHERYDFNTLRRELRL